MESGERSFDIIRLNDQFRIALKEQVEKDLNTELSDFNLTTYDEFFSAVSNRLNQIDKSGAGSLMQLLYKVDLPEKIFRQIRETSENNFIDLLADAVLRRIFQKVWTRFQFKKRI
ncbi:MAG: hypothetical protein GC181_01245 [Bacteroidetes bacterium]|nr:hypothetical protein [Bacteroidota bacterium]